jgi:hypothetical protein
MYIEKENFMLTNKDVVLGKKVRDKITGFIGIAVAEHTYINGCKRISVQPSIDKNGKVPESVSFDIPQLEIVEEEKIKGDIDTGGPDKFMDERKY